MTRGWHSGAQTTPPFSWMNHICEPNCRAHSPVPEHERGTSRVGAIERHEAEHLRASRLGSAHFVGDLIFQRFTRPLARESSVLKVT